MRRIICLWLTLLVIVLTGGCAGKNVSSRVKGENNITEQEKTLLANLYPHDAQRIRDDQLFPFQEEALNQLRAGLTYLEEKYGTAAPEVQSFDAATSYSGCAYLRLPEKDGRIPEVQVAVKGDEYSCADTWYSHLIRPAYDEMLADWLNGIGISAVCFTDFYGPMNIKVKGDEPPEQLVAMKADLPRISDIFVSAPIDVTRVEQQLKNAGLYGSYVFYYASTLGDIRELESQKAQMEHDSLTCFDV